MPKKIKDKAQPEAEQLKAPVADSLANVEIEAKPKAEPAPVNPKGEEEVIETRNGFTLFRKGTGYGVKNPQGLVIAPFTVQSEAEQLFRGMARKF